MLLVIYSHVLTYLTPVNSEINKILITFRMPLFFFIMGFFLYDTNYNFILLRQRTRNRIVRQLLPTILFFTLYVALKGGSHINSLFSAYKGGYWFTFVSVEMFIIIAPLLYYFCRKRYDKSRTAIILISAFLLTAMCNILWSCLFSLSSTNKLVKLFSLELIVHYIPYVILGCIIRMLWTQFENKIINFLWFCFALVLFCACILWNFVAKDFLMAICGIYILFYAFYNVPTNLYKGRLGSALIYIGKFTLEIYLLHYFIFGIINRATPISRVLQPLLGAANSIYEIPSILFISILIAIVCLSIVQIMKFLKIYQFAFPSIKNFRLTTQQGSYKNNQLQ